MSVTAAKGFVAAGVHAGIRKERPDLALLRSTKRAVGAAMWTVNRVQAAPVVVSKRHLALAEPQAVVVNAGVANAATGLQGEVHAESTARAVASVLGLSPEQVVVLSTGVIGVPLPIDRVLAGVRAASLDLSPDGGGAAAGAILTTDTGPKTAAVTRDGFTVGGMAKGAGMIHPVLATLLVVITTDYPLEPGEPIELLRPAVDESFNCISIDGDCSTNDAVVLLANGASGIARDAGTDAAFAQALHDVCAELARKVVEDGEGTTVLLEIEVTGAASQPEAEAVARRIATSPLVKTAAFGHDPNWGRVLMAAGSAPFNGGFARVDAGRLSVGFNGTTVFAAGAPTGETPSGGGAVCAIDVDLGLGSGRASYLASDLSYDYVRINAEYTDLVPGLVVLKVGGRVAARAAVEALALRAEGHSVLVVHGAGPQISAEMERRGIPVRFVGGRRVTSAAALEVVRASFLAVNEAVCAAIGPLAVGLAGDEIALAAVRVPSLGLVGDPLPCAPGAIVAALDAELIPVVAPLAEGPLNVNADDAAAALAVGLGAERLLFVTDVPGLLVDDAVVGTIDVDEADRMLRAGAFDGGIVPKLMAAVAAARGGVHAEIGETVVLA